MGIWPSKEKLEGIRIEEENRRRWSEEYTRGVEEAYRQLELSDKHNSARYYAFLENQQYGTPIPAPLRTPMPLSEMPDYLRPYYTGSKSTSALWSYRDQDDYDASLTSLSKQYQMDPNDPQWRTVVQRYLAACELEGHAETGARHIHNKPTQAFNAFSNAALGRLHGQTEAAKTAMIEFATAMFGRSKFPNV